MEPSARLLVATCWLHWAAPEYKDIGLELTGIETTGAGYIKTNERLQTNRAGRFGHRRSSRQPAIYHVSVDDFRVVHDSITGGKRVTAGRQIPFCLFTDPELARIA